MQIHNRAKMVSWRGAGLGRAMLLGVALLATIVRAGEEPYDLWYVIEIDGARAGWLHESVEIDSGLITTTTDTTMSMRRGTSIVKIEILSSFVENVRHEPKSWQTSVSMGSEPIRRAYVFGDGWVDVTTRLGDGDGPGKKQRVDLPGGDWLTPGGSREFLSERLASGAREISFASLDPMQRLSVDRTTLREFTSASVEVMGRTVEANRCEAISSSVPGMVSVSYFDDFGRQLRTEISIAELSIVTLAADRELAMGELDPPELMARTFVRLDAPIARPRRTSDATFLLSVREGKLADLPQNSSQRTERIDERTIRVHVRDGGRFDDGLATGSDDRTLEASTMLNWRDPKIQELAQRTAATSGAATEFRKAELMRRGVHRHIRSKDLGVGFASASEVVRTGQGDCSEHATLLAATLRAEGIPSRVVSGLIYADGFLGERNIFGYHMWTQALLEVRGERRWVDLDPTLGGSDAFDATHIALAVSTLSDSEGGNALAALVPLLGRLEVEVESIE